MPAKVIKTGIVMPNSITVAPCKDYFAVGYRTDCYGQNEWLVRFTPSYENAIAYMENEISRHQPSTLHPEYKVWKCNLDNAQVMPNGRPAQDETLDY